MADPWTAAWEEAEASNPPTLVTYDTLELHHEAFVDASVPFAVRVVNGVADPMNFTLEAGAILNGGESVEFLAVPFTAERPEFAEGKPPTTQITVDGVVDELSQYLEAAVYTRSDMKVVFRQYRSDDLTEPCYGPVEFIMKNVRMNGTRITGTAKLDDLVNRKFPNLIYTFENYPGLLNV